MIDLILFKKNRAFQVDIKAIIRELLFAHDCVIIPGFGGFIGNFSQAVLDKATGIFYPPRKEISFNRNINHNDGLLVSRISQLAAVNYGDARNLVEEFVKDMKGRLARGEKYVIDHLGTFQYNVENNVQFEPESGINYFAGSFGLESFQSAPSREYDVRRRVKRYIDKDPVRQATIKRNLWRAAVIIPIMALMVAVPLKTDLLKSKTEVTSLNPLVSAEFENNRKALDSAVAVSVATDSIKPVKPEPVITSPEELKNYCIITGSFKSEENAVSHMNTLRAEGFNPEIVKAPNGFFRVKAMTCTDIETAVASRDSILNKFPGSWISKL